MVTCDEAVATLNDEESGAKQRERALAALAELALSDSAVPSSRRSNSSTARLRPCS